MEEGAFGNIDFVCIYDDDPPGLKKMHMRTTTCLRCQTETGGKNPLSYFLKSMGKKGKKKKHLLLRAGRYAVMCITALNLTFH